MAVLIAGPLVLLKIVVATASIVGFFAIVSQPLGWQSGPQFLLCAALGAMLWITDGKLDAGTK